MHFGICAWKKLRMNMLVKLTPGVNFINISLKSFFVRKWNAQLSLVSFQLCNDRLATGIGQINCKNTKHKENIFCDFNNFSACKWVWIRLASLGLQNRSIPNDHSRIGCWKEFSWLKKTKKWALIGDRKVAVSAETEAE